MKLTRAVIEVNGQWIGTAGEQWWARMKEPVEINDAQECMTLSLRTNVTFAGKTRAEVLEKLLAHYDAIEIAVPPLTNTKLEFPA